MSTPTVSLSPSFNGWKKPPTIPGPSEPPPYFSHIGKEGKDALWVGFVVFLASTMIIAVMASRQQKRHRVFYVLTMLITSIAAVCPPFFSRSLVTA